ncbi:hypothetical protein [Brachybacterium sacelli]|uniref:hypothetical protein n=1 Tax=Brachybacterium sacelli TaxID=173364 RepID=UPI00360D5682
MNSMEWRDVLVRDGVAPVFWHQPVRGRRMRRRGASMTTALIRTRHGWACPNPGPCDLGGDMDSGRA